ncbi:hypothetical protein [Desulfurivibrio alkaliphilus]|nr:hypothetical protein [Desulfurivibrio alkaliphilus]
MMIMIAAGTATAAGPPAPVPPGVNLHVVLEKLILRDHRGDLLRYPSQLAFDPAQEEIYLLLADRGGFVVYDYDFYPHLFLGKGRGLQRPRAVFFAPADHRVLVIQGRIDQRPPSLLIFDGAYLPLIEIELKTPDTPEGEHDFVPSAGVVGRNGDIYLAGGDPRGVMVLSPEGAFRRWLPPLASGEVTGEEEVAAGPISYLTRDTQGRLYGLSEEAGKVYVYSASEELLYSFGQKGANVGQLSRPRGLALDERRGLVYVVDYMRHSVLVYSLNGRFLHEFGGRGTAPRWFNFPNAVVVDAQGRVVVADMFNHRLQVLRPEFIGPGPVGPIPAPGPSAEQPPRRDERE